MLSTEKQVCVVIPHGGSITTLGDQLAALSQQTVLPHEIIVSCNKVGGKQKLEDWLAQAPTLTAPLRLLDSSSTPGPGAARNAGWLATKCGWVLFCDDDDVVAPGWVEAMVGALRTSDISAGSLRYEALNSMRAARRSNHASHRPPTKFAHLYYGPSSNLGTSREVLKRLNGFDETTLSAEDIDFCWRVQYEGLKFAFTPDAIVQYRMRSTFSAVFQQSFQYGLSDGWLLERHRTYGARRTVKDTLKDLAGIPLSLVRMIVGRGDLLDFVQRVGALAGRVSSSLRYRIWVV